MLYEFVRLGNKKLHGLRCHLRRVWGEWKCVGVVPDDRIGANWREEMIRVSARGQFLLEAVRVVFFCDRPEADGYTLQGGAQLRFLFQKPWLLLF